MVTITGDITPNRNRPLYNAVIGTPVVTNEGAEPLTLEEVKAHLNIDTGFTADDDKITKFMKACRQKIEDTRDISLVSKTVEAVIKNERGGQLLPYGRVSTITGAVDDQGDAIDSNDYEVLDDSLLTKFDYIKITYTTTPKVTESLIQDLLELIAYHYEHRGDEEKPKIASAWLV